MKKTFNLFFFGIVLSYTQISFASLSIEVNNPITLIKLSNIHDNEINFILNVGRSFFFTIKGPKDHGFSVFSKEVSSSDESYRKHEESKSEKQNSIFISHDKGPVIVKIVSREGTYFSDFEEKGPYYIDIWKDGVPWHLE